MISPVKALGGLGWVIAFTACQVAGSTSA